MSSIDQISRPTKENTMKKIILFIIGLCRAFPDSRGRSNENCADLDIGEQCLDLCNLDLIKCYNECLDDSCKSSCHREHPPCIDGNIVNVLRF